MSKYKRQMMKNQLPHFRFLKIIKCRLKRIRETVVDNTNEDKLILSFTKPQYKNVNIFLLNQGIIKRIYLQKTS